MASRVIVLRELPSHFVVILSRTDSRITNQLYAHLFLLGGSYACMMTSPLVFLVLMPVTVFLYENCDDFRDLEFMEFKVVKVVVLQMHVTQLQRNFVFPFCFSRTHWQLSWHRWHWQENHSTFTSLHPHQSHLLFGLRTPDVTVRRAP